MTGTDAAKTMRVQTSAAFRAELAELLRDGVPFPAEEAPGMYQTGLLMESDGDAYDVYFELMLLTEDTQGELSGKCLLHIDNYVGEERQFSRDYYAYDQSVYPALEELWGRYTIESTTEIEGPALLLATDAGPADHTAFAAEADGRLALWQGNYDTGEQWVAVYSLETGEKLSEMPLTQGDAAAEHSSYAHSQFCLRYTDGHIEYYDIAQINAPVGEVSLPPALAAVHSQGMPYDIDPESGVAVVAAKDKLSWADAAGNVSTIPCEGIPTEDLEDVEDPQFFFGTCRVLREGRYIFADIQRATPGGQSDSVTSGILLYDTQSGTPHFIMGKFSSWNTGFFFDAGERVLGMAYDGTQGVLEVDFTTMQVKPATPQGLYYGPGMANYRSRHYAEVKSETTEDGAARYHFYVDGAAAPTATVTSGLFSTYIGPMTQNYLLFQVDDAAGRNTYAVRYT